MAKNYRGLSSYMTWVLVGLRLGYKVVPHNKKMYHLLTKEGELKDTVYKSAILSMKGKGLITIKEDGLGLTSAGFDMACDRLKIATDKL